MRKLVLVFGMLVTMAFASCGNSTNGSDEQKDTVNVDTIEVVDSTVIDSTVVDSAAVSLN